MSAVGETSRSGGCLCGAVRFEADLDRNTFGVCHCEMCRRWTGSAFMAITTPAANIRWSGEEHIARIQSSDWAERAFCRTCGSALYYHQTQGAHAASLELPIGLFDDASGLKMVREIFTDRKPDCFAYAGEDRQTLTRAEVMHLFAPAANT